MNLHDFLGSPLVSRLGLTLLHSLWQFVGLAVLLHFALLAGQRAAARTRYAAACLAMVGLVVVPVATFFVVPPPAAPGVEAAAEMHGVSGGVLEGSPKVETVGARDVSKAGGVPVVRAESGASAGRTREAARAVPERSAVAAPAEARNWTVEAARVLSPYLVAAWLAGVLALATRQGIAWALLSRLTRRKTSAIPGHLLKLVESIAGRMNLRRPLRVLACAAIDVPTVLGVLKPTILIPLSAVTQLPARDLETILAHELAHILRHDYLVNLLQSVVETLAFYHPATWYISSRMRQERELACDDLALSLGGDPVTYAESLAALASLSVPALSLGATGPNHHGSLLARIRRLLKLPAPPQSRMRSLLATAAALACVIVCVAASGCFKNEPASKAAATAPATTAASTLPLREGDVGEYYIMGHIPRPGVYSLAARKLNIKQALAAAGCTDIDLQLSVVTLTRRVGESEEVQMLTRVPLADIVSGKHTDIFLQPNDILEINNPREAWASFLAAKEELNTGAAREKVAEVFAAVPDADAQEIGKLLRAMALEDKKFVEPADPAKLGEKERLEYLVYKLRDVAEHDAFVPGKVSVLFYPHDRASAAVQLRKLGKPAVPTLLSLLGDRRPTRSVGNPLNGGKVLRYCDVALEILEAMSGEVFDGRTQRGAYLSTATPEERGQIVGRVMAWWNANQNKTEAEWIHQSLEQHGLGSLGTRLDFAERLVELEGPACMGVLRQCRKKEPDNEHVVRLLWLAGGTEALEDLKDATRSSNAYIRGMGYRYLIEAEQNEYIAKEAEDLNRAVMQPNKLLWLAGGTEALEDLKDATRSSNAYIRGMGYRYLIEAEQNEYIAKAAEDLNRAVMQPNKDFKGVAGEQEYVPLMDALAYSANERAVLAVAAYMGSANSDVARRAEQTVLNARRYWEPKNPGLAAKLVPYLMAFLETPGQDMTFRFWAATVVVQTTKVPLDWPKETPTPEIQAEKIRQLQTWWKQHAAHSTTPATTQAAIHLEMRLVDQLATDATTVDVFPDVDDPPSELKVLKTALADESLYQKATVEPAGRRFVMNLELTREGLNTINQILRNHPDKEIAWVLGNEILAVMYIAKYHPDLTAPKLILSLGFVTKLQAGQKEKRVNDVLAAVAAKKAASPEGFDAWRAEMWKWVQDKPGADEPKVKGRAMWMGEVKGVRMEGLSGGCVVLANAGDGDSWLDTKSVKELLIAFKESDFAGGRPKAGEFWAIAAAGSDVGTKELYWSWHDARAVPLKMRLYNDDEAAQFNAAIAKLKYPTTIDDACKTLGIDPQRIGREWSVGETSNGGISHSTQLSTHQYINFESDAAPNAARIRKVEIYHDF